MKKVGLLSQLDDGLRPGLRKNRPREIVRAKPDSECPFAPNSSPDKESGVKGDERGPLEKSGCAVGMADPEDRAEGTNEFKFRTRGPERMWRRRSEGSGETERGDEETGGSRAGVLT